MKESRHPHPHLDPREPRHRSRPRTNPPLFSWKPPGKETGFRLQVAMDRDFEKAIMDMDGLVDPVYLPETALKIGVYFWRWTLGEVESEVFEFEVPEDAVVLEVPSVDTWLQSLPDGHPRLYLLPEDLKNFRESNGGDRSDMREMLLESATGLLDTPHQMDEQTCSPGDRRDT